MKILLLPFSFQGISLPANANQGRKPRQLYIFPGGIAEIYTSKPGNNAIFFKSRKGLTRLSVETGAELVPVYVFGGTDFYHNLLTADTSVSRLFRKFRLGFTIFWGQFGLPIIPLTPKVTMIFGNPIPIPEINESCSKEEAMEILHTRFMEEMVNLFDRYKGIAGYPEATLEIL
jgi:1-acyl-sn-glycerol-3-phosphate acyltransferase